MKSKKYFYLSALSLALSALLCGLPLTALGANGSETDGKDKSGTTAVALEDNSGKMKKLGKYGLPEDSLYFKNEVMPDTWVFTDGLGRKALTNADVGAPRSDREVVIFYSDWHDNFSKNCRPFNVQQFLDKEAKRGVNLSDIINDYRYSGWPTGSVQHFWNTPVYGYYSTADEWVLRRQAELLANAGIDAISTDNTNGTYTWKSSYDAIFETWSKAMDDGVAAPKVSFMLPFASGHDTNEQLKSLYFDIYSTGKYRDLWYMRDGQPLIMAHPEGLAVSSDYLQSQIMSFFNFRYNYPGYINSNPAVKNWGWLSVYPQAVYYASNEDRQNGIIEQITVGAAENHDYVRHELTAMNGKNVTDRTWTSLGYDTRPDAKLWGANLAEQFGYALEKDPKVIYLTGWNEWIAGRFSEWQGVENAFPDEFNDIASRDIEPSRGELKDHYYYQTVNFIRQYKGVRAIPEPTFAKRIDITSDVSQWADVGPYYAAYIGNTGDREHYGYVGYNYSDSSGRNDIIGAQIARDGEYIYILVECADDITPCTDPLWMNVLLDTEAEGGWEGYDYVINKTAPKDSCTAVLERFTGDGYASEYVADVKMNLNGRYLQLAVRKSDLGISGNSFTLNFSVTDNVHDIGDSGTFSPGKKSVYSKFSGNILEFYTSGDVAPGGRFMYSYISTDENTGAIPEISSAAAPETSDDGGPRKGCGGSAAVTAAAAFAALGGAMCRKKNENE